MRVSLALVLGAATLAMPFAAKADNLNLSTGVAQYYVVGPSDTFPGVLAPTISPNSAWMATIPGASWINESGNAYASDPAGTYLYYTYFTLTSTSTLSGSFSSDNEAVGGYFSTTGGEELGANMYGTDPSTYSFNTVTPLETTELGPGLYALAFYVTNGDVDTGGTDGAGPTGLLAGVSTVSATPEPSSLVLLGTGILGLAGAARRKMRS